MHLLAFDLGVFLYDTLHVVKPVACCSVQHHEVSVTTVWRTFAGDVLCGLVCKIIPPISFSKSLLPMPCWSSYERQWLVAWLALRKGGGIAVAFVLVRLLSRYCVACGGRLLQHGGIMEDIVCFCGCQEALPRRQLVAWMLVLIACMLHRVGVCVGIWTPHWWEILGWGKGKCCGWCLDNIKLCSPLCTGQASK